MTASANPRMLILETSSRLGQVALAEGPQLLAAQTLDEARRHARDLAPAVAELLTAAGWQPRQLDAVLVSRGPGSYTGLRVGIISAKTLAYATGCRLLAIDTFAAIARQAPKQAHILDVLADAQQGRIYWQPYRRVDDSNWEAIAPLSIRSFDDWLAHRAEDAWATGPGLHEFRSRLPRPEQVVAAECWDSRPASLLSIGLQRWFRGEYDELWGLEPLYLRPSSAEEKWLDKGARTLYK